MGGGRVIKGKGFFTSLSQQQQPLQQPCLQLSLSPPFVLIFVLQSLTYVPALPHIVPSDSLCLQSPALQTTSSSFQSSLIGTQLGPVDSTPLLYCQSPPLSCQSPPLPQGLHCGYCACLSSNPFFHRRSYELPLFSPSSREDSALPSCGQGHLSLFLCSSQASYSACQSQFPHL